MFEILLWNINWYLFAYKNIINNTKKDRVGWVFKYFTGFQLFMLNEEAKNISCYSICRLPEGKQMWSVGTIIKNKIYNGNTSFKTRFNWSYEKITLFFRTQKLEYSDTVFLISDRKVAKRFSHQLSLMMIAKTQFQAMSKKFFYIY